MFAVGHLTAISHAKPLEIILSESGTHFDPVVVSVFQNIPQAFWISLAASASDTKCFADVVRICRTLRERQQVADDKSSDQAAAPIGATVGGSADPS